MKYLSYLAIICFMAVFGCKSTAPLPTVSHIDIDRYSGTWYEIARITHHFEKGLEKVSTTYIPRADGKIIVLNQGSKTSDTSVIKKARGIASIPDPAYPERLKVQFFWPFKGNYWILDLDTNYQRVLIGDPTRKYLWILSRTKTMEAAEYNRLTDIAEKAGFDISRLERIRQ